MDLQEQLEIKVDDPTVLLKDVIREIERTNFPVITSDKYPTAWWQTSMGLEISYQISKMLSGLLDRVKKLEE
uniref:Uncharacterized protein n=1 Tax=viral metagenome TaxID=1070528 RepID=A0A6H1ZY05_9ZZZZ